MNIRNRLSTIVTILIAVLIMAQTVNAVTFNEFPVPTANSTPFRITFGPDNTLWFTEQSGNKIGRITTEGVITEFPIPTADSQPVTIVTGPHGNLWFTELNGNKIGRITTDGVITEFLIPTANSQPSGIRSGPDGNIWFTERNGNNIGRITTEGVITEFPIPTANSQPTSLRVGPDGNIWFTENNGNKIGQMSLAGVVLNEFSIPTNNSQPNGIHNGPDGSLWFCEQNGNRIGKITLAGVVTEFLLPFASSNPRIISNGTDGDLWFTVYGPNGNKLDQITTEGSITEFTIPTPSSAPGNVIVGPDGNLWFTEQNGNKIGQAIINAGMMAVPSGKQIIPISPPIVFPIINPVSIQAAPIGIGSIAVGGSIFNLEIGLGPFSAPVDIYAAFTLSTVPGEIRILNPDGKTFQTFTMNQIVQALSTGVPPAGLEPSVSNTSGGLYVPLLQNVPVSNLPVGTYNLYIAVFPAGNLSAYYIWQTTFTL